MYGCMTGVDAERVYGIESMDTSHVLGVVASRMKGIGAECVKDVDAEHM